MKYLLLIILSGAALAQYGGYSIKSELARVTVGGSNAPLRGIGVPPAGPAPALTENSSLIGGVVPHHDLVAHEIERFWQTLSENASPDVILLIGPDHRDIAASELVTTSVTDPFETPVNLAESWIASTRDRGMLRTDPNAFRGEHSIGLHLPFIARFFPNASVFPILARSDASQAQVIALASELRAANTDSAIAIVASVDFSHERTREEAEAYDDESIDALTTFDTQALSHFGPEHMDSDQSILFVSEYGCPAHSCEWETLYHGNSSDLPYQNAKVTTSYFSLVLHPALASRTKEENVIH